MSIDPTGDRTPPTTGPGAVTYDRFSHVRVDDDLLVYDRDGEDAWLQSDTFVTLDAMR